VTDGLPHRSIRFANVQAWRIVVGPPDIAFNGGPVLTDPADDSLRHCRYGKPVDRFDPTARFDQILPGTWNYVGPVYPHFGHVMSEMIHRVLPSRNAFQHDQWLAVDGLNSPTITADSLPPAYRAAIGILGVDASNLRIINRDTVVERLNICAQGAQFGYAPHSQYLLNLRDFSDHVLDRKFADLPRDERVYVTRTGLPEAGNFLGESYLEEAFRTNGFAIFRPEEHPLDVQMDVYRKAKLLVFSEGSACHGTELLGSRSLTHVCMLVRRPEHRDLFQKVLQSRSVRYDEIMASVNVGSVVMHPTLKSPLPNYSQAVFQIRKLVGRLRELEVLADVDLDIAAYSECVTRDFEGHIRATMARLALVGGDDVIDSVRQRILLCATEQLSVSATPSGSDREAALPDLGDPGYLQILKRAHEQLRPRAYLEIGSFEGASLTCASGMVLAIDPDFSRLKNWARNKSACLFFQMTSDVFFASYDPKVYLGGEIDLAFLDGLHLIENLLKDFINVEKHCARGSVILMHDCLPTDVGIADRVNHPSRRPLHPDWWTGDVWKIIPILQEHRPDLVLRTLDAAPTGLVVVTNLNPKSTKLSERYDLLCEQWKAIHLREYGLSRLHGEANVTAAGEFDFSKST
jgi:hypothetical protein